MPADNRRYGAAAAPQARHARAFPAAGRGAKTAFGRRVFEPHRRVRALRRSERQRRWGLGRPAALLFLGAILLAVLPM